MAPPRRPGSRVPSLPPLEQAADPSIHRRSPRKHGSSVTGDPLANEETNPADQETPLPVRRSPSKADQGTPTRNRELKALGITSATRLNQSYSYGSSHVAANKRITGPNNAAQLSVRDSIRQTTVPMSRAPILPLAQPARVPSLPELVRGRQTSVELRHSLQPSGSDMSRAPSPGKSLLGCTSADNY